MGMGIGLGLGLSIGLGAGALVVNNGIAIAGTEANETCAAAVQTFPAGMQVWFRADRGVTGTTQVTQLDDQSANGYHVTHAAGTGCPDATAVTQNGRVALRFTAASLQYLKRDNTNVIGSGAYTFIWAGKVRASLGAEGFFANMKAGAGATLYLDTGPVRAIFNPGVAVADDGAITANAEIWTAIRPAASVPTMRVNGTDQGALSGASGSMGDVTSSGFLIIGAMDLTVPFGYADVDFYEGFMFNVALSAGEATSIETYLNAKWAIF